MIAVPFIVFGIAGTLLFIVGVIAVANDGKRAYSRTLIGLGQFLAVVMTVCILWLVVIAVLGVMGVRA